MELRYYQREAVDATYDFLRTREGSPLIVLPTGSGKSLVIAQIATDVVTKWGGRALILSHVKELLEQNYNKIRQLCRDVPAGLYSAGLGQRCTDASIIVAGIQSVYRRACELGPFDLVIVDEAHLLSDDDDTMYGQFLRDARQVGGHTRLVGATASPFRTTSGYIYGAGKIFSDVCYETGVKELIAQGYLSPLVSKSGTTRVDTSALHVRRGEFAADEVEQLMDQDGVVENACREIVEYTKDRRKCLIFAAGVAHGRHIERVLREEHGQACGFLSATTPPTERAELIARFRDEPDGLFDREPLKYLVNVGILLVGFDAPATDCVVLLRPTHSCGLYLQAVGRAFRLHPGKSDALILDFGNNIVRHGPVDQLNISEKSAPGNGKAPAKECPECHSVVAAGYATCPDCGYVFPPPERQKHEAEASSEGILSGQVTITEYDVHDTYYCVHVKRGADDESPRTMRVDYRVGLSEFKSEWICFEHDGFARQKAIAWWRHRSPDPIPQTAQEAVDIANAGGVAIADKITVRSIAGEPFDRVTDYELGPMPDPVPAGDFDDSEIPF
ncbi:MAG: DEAD/DEAH box helicase family protein [Pirellulaceae bacterium]